MDAANLAEVSIFEGMSDAELADCAASFEELEVLTGTTMTEKDDFGYTFFVVLSGELAVERDGAEVARLGAGDSFGEQALLGGDRRNATVTALERTRLAKMMVWDMSELLEKNQVLAGRIQEIADSRR
jgi:CRP-like cAMP-binding protein